MDLSIIIPTLNEENYIEKTLDYVFNNQSGRFKIEVIIVDSGSIDDTVNLTSNYDVTIFEKPEFIGNKYLSLNYGAKMSRGTNFLFLDADCLLPFDYDFSITNVLKNKNVVGGAFEFEMSGKGILFGIIKIINRIRYRIVKRYYGDQGVFCNKNAFDTIGGYPEKPIMEAAYFCNKLSKVGSLKLIKSKITSSTRRFEEGGILKVMAKDTFIWIQFLMGLDISKYASKYWEENKLRGSNPN